MEDFVSKPKSWHAPSFITALLNFSEDCSLEVLHILSNVLNLPIGKDISTVSLEDLRRDRERREGLSP